jgi:ribosomal protein L40E
MKICITCLEREAEVGKQCRACYEDDLDDYNKEKKDEK